jgi:predicted dehydrogenase
MGKPGRPGANDRVQVGYIGIGRRAGQLTGIPADAVAVAYADVNRKRLEQWKSRNPSAKIYDDYRELLQSPEVDAVVIATPDHWHILCAVHACQAGKDVYIEKPLSLTIHEGRVLVDTARKLKRIVQVGSQQRSMQTCQAGTRLVREGRVGKIHTVHGANYPSPWECDLPEEPVPAEINWDMWCGQTEPRSYHTDLYLPRADGRTYPDKRPLGWISYRPYSGGEMTGWGAHGLDIALWGLGEAGPVEVWPEPDVQSGPLLFFGKELDPALAKEWKEGPKLTCPVTFRFAGGAILKLDSKGPGGGALFEGDDGSILVDRGKYSLRPKSGEAQNAKEPEGMDDTRAHLKNWVDCIRSRQRPAGDVELGHWACNVCHLGNIARWTGRRLTWDPKAEQFVKDPDANAYLQRPMRKPWTL